MVLLANKCDLENKIVTTVEGRRMAEQYKIPFFEVSAKTGENVTNAFESLANIIYQRVKSKPTPQEEIEPNKKLTVMATN